MASRSDARRAFAIIAVTVAACSSGSPSNPPVPVARAEVQHLRVAVGEDEFLLGDAPDHNLGILVEGLNPGIFETLTVLTPTFGLRPGLAVAWEARSPTKWRFELRQDVRFHDGTPLTANAVVETFRQMTGGTAEGGLGNGDGGDADGVDVPLRPTRPRGLEPDSASAVDDHVIDIELSQPNLRLAEQLANPRLAVQAPGTQAGDGSTPALTPTGTGPFSFSSYRPGVELGVLANPDYWAGPPQLDSITFLFGADEDASLLLATGDVDAVGYVDPDVLANVSGGSDRLVSSTAARSALLLLNRGGVDEWSTLEEDAVRQAVAMALDPQAIIDAAWPETGDPNGTVIPAVVLGAAVDEVTTEPGGAAAAGALLDDAGWTLRGGARERGGERLELDVLVRRDADGLPAAAAAITEQLAAVGIATTVDEDGSGIGIGIGEQTPLQRVNAATFDLFVDLRAQDDANPCALCRFFSVGPGADLTVAGVVGAGPAADERFDLVHSAPSIDPARRLAAELMQVAVRDAAVVVPLATLSNVWLLSSAVEGFDPAPLGGAQTWDTVFLSR